MRLAIRLLAFLFCVFPVFGAHGQVQSSEVIDARASGIRIADERAQRREEKRRLRQQRREERDRENERRRARPPSPVWLSAGANISSFADSREDCGGGQLAVSADVDIMLRVQYSHVSAQDTVRRDNCDGMGAAAGRSYAGEYAFMGGFALGRSGFFVVGGPARLDFESVRGESTVSGRARGIRYEAGWSARQLPDWIWPFGVEAAVFKDDNDLRDFYGFELNITYPNR